MNLRKVNEMKNQLTTVAALPGSGGGMTSSLPCEVWTRAVKPVTTKALLKGMVDSHEKVKQAYRELRLQQSGDRVHREKAAGKKDVDLYDLYPQFKKKERRLPENKQAYREFVSGDWVNQRRYRAMEDDWVTDRYFQGKLLYTLDKDGYKVVT